MSANSSQPSALQTYLNWKVQTSPTLTSLHYSYIHLYTLKTPLCIQFKHMLTCSVPSMLIEIMKLNSHEIKEDCVFHSDCSLWSIKSLVVMWVWTFLFSYVYCVSACWLTSVESLDGFTLLCDSFTKLLHLGLIFLRLQRVKVSQQQQLCRNVFFFFFKYFFWRAVKTKPLYMGHLLYQMS